MTQLLRQLATALIVTLVAIGLTISVGNASMALACERIDVTASTETLIGQDDHSTHDSPDRALSNANPSDTHPNDNGAGSNAQAEHCTTHACPAAFYLSADDSVRAVSLSQAMATMRIDPLVELTVPERLRRPPRG